MKRILVTNDDGIEAAGLAVLVRVAEEIGEEVVIAAPAGERSGSAAALSVVSADGESAFREVRCDAAPTAAAFSVKASPALITLLAMEGEFGRPPDVVLSGINHGPNTGTSVLHSGTVGAAFTAAARGIPALAFSQLGAAPRRWATATEVVRTVLGWGVAHAPPGVVINVNVPDCPPESLRGLRYAHLAPFGAAQAQVTATTHTETVTLSSHEETQQADSDAALVAAGWATVTPVVAPCEVPADLGTLLAEPMAVAVAAGPAAGATAGPTAGPAAGAMGVRESAGRPRT